jgi:type I restriction enzyme M protein
MLDNETKRRIDTARDILVGKVPDPKSQVEQITIALVYKFMDDMDKEAIELGGNPSFFTGDYEQYAWSKIFDPRIGGYEMLSLYSEAIVKLNQNPNLPQLFRDIFKNAYLPYRDPETLKLFLKTINEFTYDHSERLGDAFEYLLSVLGSQGDAGQFRTPRHIIDFMVEIVAPQKHETILDPACGTAGFLISSYKYILRENTSEKYRSSNGNYRGDLLKPEERKNLLKNFKGYDISPDMVRLSLVNMYLHGFVQPQIYEYDTLTSEDRWNEYADVILANPPFMTPKGGIRPHKRFSVQSNRSEVLFVDYIAEHLTSTGRAAVIVPEGIIFQSANAYKQLRKMLVENCLHAVVSLPAGVFQPYSGVKTSILLMDKQLAKKADAILFVKIENDGYDLGAQRREIDKNDLPDAVNCLQEWRKFLLSRGQDIQDRQNDKKEIKKQDTHNINKDNKQDVQDRHDKQKQDKQDIQDENNPTNPVYPVNIKIYFDKETAIIVKKEKLAESGEYNLTGDRYRVVEVRRHQKWPMVRLGEVCETTSGGTPLKSKKEYYENGTIPWLRSGEVSQGEIYNSEFYITELGLKKSSAKLFPKNTVLVAMYGATAGQVGLLKFESSTNQAICGILPNDKFLPEFLYQILKSQKENMIRLAGGGAQPNISQTIIKNLLIPLPPLEVQKEIVAEIEGYQKLIDGCRQVIDNWKPDIEGYLDEELKQYLTEHPDKKEELAEGWPMVRLGEVCEDIKSGFASGNSEKEIGEILHLRPMNISSKGDLILEGSKYIKKEEFDPSFSIKKGDVLFNNTNSKELVGKTCYVYKDLPNTGYSNHLTRIRTGSKLNSYFLSLILQGLYQKEYFLNLCNKWVGQAGINNKILSSLFIPLPPLEVQSRIVECIEAERKVIEGCRELIKTYEEKIKRVIDKVWGE